MYKLFEDEKPHKVQTKEIVDDLDTLEATIEEVANYFLHRIDAQPKILPYTDMVRWIIDNLNIRDMTFLTSIGMMIGSFKAEDLKLVYHIPDSEKVYDK